MSLPQGQSMQVPVFALQHNGHETWLHQRRLLCVPAMPYVPAQAIKVFRAWLGYPAEEPLIALWVNSQNRIVGVHSVGDDLHTGYQPQESKVFDPPTLALSTTTADVQELVFVERHRNEPLKPTLQDLRLFRRMVRWSLSYPVRVKDYVIISNAHTRFFSFVEDHLMPPPRLMSLGALVLFLLIVFNPSLPIHDRLAWLASQEQSVTQGCSAPEAEAAFPEVTGE